MFKLPPINNEYESNIIDEYTEYFFMLKEENEYRERSYLSYHSRYSYRYNDLYNNRRNSYYSRIDELNYRLNYLREVCFNKRESIIPPYFIKKITQTKKYYSVMEKQYTNYIKSIIQEKIDCYLMDTKNMSNIIYEYGSKEIMYNYYKYGIGYNKRCIIVSHIINCPFLLNYYVPYDRNEKRDYEEYSKEEERRIYEWENRKPSIYKIEEIIFNSKEKVSYDTVNNKEYNCIELYTTDELSCKKDEDDDIVNNKKYNRIELYKKDEDDDDDNYKYSITDSKEKIIKDVLKNYLSMNIKGDLYRYKEKAIKEYIFYTYIL